MLTANTLGVTSQSSHQPPFDRDAVVTRAEAAAILGCSTSSIGRLVRRSRLVEVTDDNGAHWIVRESLADGGSIAHWPGIGATER